MIILSLLSFVLTQDVITTKQYTFEINSNIENINILELINEYDGDFIVEIFKYQSINNPENPCSIKLDSDLGSSDTTAYNSDNTDIQFYINEDNIIDRIRLNIEVGGLVVNSQNPNLNIDKFETAEDLYYANTCSNYSGDLTIRVTGKFSDTDVGLQGDMNDDNELDVLDVVVMVDIIVNGGGFGNIGDLLNIVRG